MKIYTRTGDAGDTGLFGGPRVDKDDTRVEAYGAVDELNAVLGVARAGEPGEAIDRQLATIQSELFAVGAELATPDPDKHAMRIIGARHIERLERWIDEHEQTLPPLRHFILPDGSAAATQLHVARAVCRRAERRVVRLMRDVDAAISADLVVYLNRLSDLLFVLARAANHAAGRAETQWERPESQSEQ